MSRPGPSRGGFTLVELLVCVGLSTILLGVVAVSFRSTLDVRDHALARVEGEQRAAAAMERLEGDGRRAAAPPDLTRFFLLACTEQPRSRSSTPAHIDALEMVIMEPGGLVRVRYSVAWDPARDAGFLWYERAGVGPDELPGALRSLASSAPREEPRVLLYGVTGFRVRLVDETGHAHDPPGGFLDGEVSLAWSGRGAVVHDRLVLTDAPPAALRPGALLWLRDDVVGRPGLDPGYYPVARVDGRAVTLARRAGACDRAAVRARWLPERLVIEVQARGKTHAINLPLDESAQPASLAADALRESVLPPGGRP